ncbi:hypothetical protein PybrP1_002811 [[Pythium] brassicae (nom. inval.)]|nr:hypothetical protein PybrP1_002811 [[Pythium] brassicae (nom. inval.)]
MSGKDAYSTCIRMLDGVYRGDNPTLVYIDSTLPRRQDGSNKITDEPSLLLPLTFDILRAREQRNVDIRGRHRSERPKLKPRRLFSLLPLKNGFRASYHTMCAVSLRSLLLLVNAEIKAYKSVHDMDHTMQSLSNAERTRAISLLHGARLGWFDVPTKSEWKATIRAQWCRFFKPQKHERTSGAASRRELGDQIKTDGFGVSVLLRVCKIRTADSSDSQHGFSDVNGAEAAVDRHELWGLDPGRSMLFVASSSTGRSARCSMDEYYTDAGFKRRLRTIQHWQLNNAEVRDAIANMTSAKTASLERLKLHVATVTRAQELLLSFETHRPYRQLRFRHHGLARRKLDQLANNLTMLSKRSTTIGYGNWSGSNSRGVIKGGNGVPVNKFATRLAARCRVESIDEFRTSQVHHDCPTRNSSAPEDHTNNFNHIHRRKQTPEGKTKIVKIHRVLHCTRSNGGCGITVDRDINASLNILQLLVCHIHNEDRPPALSRPHASAPGRFLSSPLLAPCSSLWTWASLRLRFDNGRLRTAILTKVTSVADGHAGSSGARASLLVPHSTLVHLSNAFNIDTIE